ncbi:MAG TPA: hypothetical protein VE130_13395 [Nitrososphaeraceae archaeon]|nr:hypothetical protein [Nitrososphaeraceae archaeon]
MNEKLSKAERVAKYNEKFNVPDQTELEEAETTEDARPENLADERTIRQRKGLETNQ